MLSRKVINVIPHQRALLVWNNNHIRHYAKGTETGVQTAPPQRQPGWVDPNTAPPSEPLPERPWGGKIRGLTTFTVLPAIVLYQVFYADFGDGEHIFSPARRWLNSEHHQPSNPQASPTQPA